MVRIPESAVTVRQGGGSIQPIREVVLIGDAVTNTIGAAVDLSSRLGVAERKVELSRMSAQMEGQLADLQLEIAQNPEFDTVESAEQAFNDGAESIFSALGTSSSQAVNEAIEKQFLRSSLQGRVFAKQTGFQRQADAAVAQLAEDGSSLERAYAVAPDEEKRAEIRALYARSINLSDYLTEQQKGDLIRAFNASVDTNRVQALLNDDRPDLALALLQDENELPGLDSAARESFEEEAIGKLRGNAEAELDIRVSRGQSTEAEIREFREQGVITSSAMARKIITLDRIHAEQAQAQIGLVRVAAALNGVGNPLDPKNPDDKNGLDHFYQSLIVPQLEGLNSDQRANAIIGLVNHPGIGMLPKSLQSEIRGKLRSGTNAQVVEASDMIDRVHTKVPRALDDFSPEDIEFGRNVTKQIRAGTPPGEAVKYAKEVELVPEAAQKVLRDRFRLIGSRDVIAERIEVVADIPFTLRSRNVPAQYEGELIELAEISYLRNGGDLDLALDVAQLQLDRVWASTSVDGGSTRFMKYAPEAVYTQFPDSETLREQLLEDVNENAIPQFPIERIRLVADLVTARSNPTDYVVELLQENGEWIPLLRNGAVRRFFFDFPSSPEGRRRAEENAQLVDSAKERHIFLQSMRAWVDRTVNPTPTPVPTPVPTSTPPPGGE